MAAAKIEISLKQSTLHQLDRLVRSRDYRTRSEAIQLALEEKLARLERSRLTRECAKLDPKEEHALAESGLELAAPPTRS